MCSLAKNTISLQLLHYHLELTYEVWRALYVAMIPVRIVKRLKRMDEIHVGGGSA